MTGLGMVIMFFGYCIVYWGIQAISLNNQPPFMTYIFPWTEFTGPPAKP